MLGDIFGFVAAFLVGWIGLGTGLMYLIHTVRFLIPFSRELVREQIYDRATHKRVVTAKWVSTLVLLALSGALSGFLIGRGGGMDILMTVLGALVGVLRGRHLLLDREGNIRRFARTHAIYLDQEKAAAYFKRAYGVDWLVMPESE